MIRRENEVFMVEGERVEKLVAMTNFAYHDPFAAWAASCGKWGSKRPSGKRGRRRGIPSGLANGI